MLDKLPSELLYIICQKLDLLSINKLRNANSSLYYKINNLSSLILNNQIQKINKNLNQYFITTFLTNFCKTLLYKHIYNQWSTKSKYDSLININTNNNPVKDLTNFLEKYKIEKTMPYLYVISYNKHINTLFKIILEHYVYYGNLESFDKINLLIMYNFIQIEQFNIKDLNYYISYIEELTLNKYITNYDDVILNYYTFIIKNLNLEDSFIYSQDTNYTKYVEILSLENLYKISKWIITPHIMQKLLNYKPLNLYNSQVLTCCNLCYKKPIHKVIKTKFDLRHDELIGHNYLCIKDIIKQNSNTYIIEKLLTEIELYEKTLVNRYIMITNPKTNIKTKFNPSEKLYSTQLNIIKKNQKFLINKIFK